MRCANRMILAVTGRILLNAVKCTGYGSLYGQELTMRRSMFRIKITGEGYLQRTDKHNQDH